MKVIEAAEIRDAVAEMCIDANLHLSPEMKNKIVTAEKTEKGDMGRRVLGQLMENLEVADESRISICQDTGMVVFFVELGQDVRINGGLTEAINAGVRKGYTEGYLRKSVVSDPILRRNTNDNTPAIIHYDVVPGDHLKITIAPKGFGSENMSRIFMLKPADGVEGIRKSVVDTVRDAGPNACPPFVVGVGLGGDFELAAELSKRALLRDPDIRSEKPHIAALEEDLLKEINALGIGPAGLGGSTTALAVNIETYATHIAGMPCAVNMCCHVDRHKTVMF